MGITKTLATLVLFILLMPARSESSTENEIQTLRLSGCTHTHDFKWTIVRKISGDSYQAMMEALGPFKKTMPAVLDIQSLSAERPGVIDELIFLKNTGKVLIEDKNGFDIKVEKFVESVECKKKWLEIEFSEDKRSYPRLGESIFTQIRQKHLVVTKRKAEEEEKQSNKQFNTTSSTISKDLTIAGFKKFSDLDCTKSSIWKIGVDWGSQSERDGYLIYYLNTKSIRNNLGFNANKLIPIFYVKRELSEDSSSEFLIKTQKFYQGKPIYERSKDCESIYKKNINKTLNNE